MTAKAMMRAKFKRPRGFHNEGHQIRKRVTELVAKRFIMGLRDFQYSILQTPVYTGRTLVNFRWSVGAPVQGTRPAVKDPELPGKTSSLGIGQEPRRPANAAVVQQEFEALLLRVRENPFQDVFLTNNVDHFTEVEYGTYARDGVVARTPPGGMTRRGEILLQYNLMGFIRRVA